MRGGSPFFLCGFFNRQILDSNGHHSFSRLTLLSRAHPRPFLFPCSKGIYRVQVPPLSCGFLTELDAAHPVFFSPAGRTRASVHRIVFLPTKTVLIYPWGGRRYAYGLPGKHSSPTSPECCFLFFWYEGRGVLSHGPAIKRGYLLSSLPPRGEWQPGKKFVLLSPPRSNKRAGISFLCVPHRIGAFPSLFPPSLPDG